MPHTLADLEIETLSSTLNKANAEALVDSFAYALGELQHGTQEKTGRCKGRGSSQCCGLHTTRRRSLYSGRNTV